jgi:hypothetical protein
MRFVVGATLPIEVRIMRANPRIIALALTAAIAVTSVTGARAGVNPGMSTVPCGIILVGVDSHGTPDPAGAFTITVRHAYGDGLAFADVWLQFQCPDVSLCSAQKSPGIAIVCSGGSQNVYGTTDASGQIAMTLIGAGTGHQPCSALGCVTIYASWGFYGFPIAITDGYTHPYVNVATPDLNGNGGVTAADLSQFLSDSFHSSYCARSDFDHGVKCVSSIGAADLSRWLTSFFGGYVFGCNSLPGTICQ